MLDGQIVPDQIWSHSCQIKPVWIWDLETVFCRIVENIGEGRRDAFFCQIKPVRIVALETRHMHTNPLTNQRFVRPPIRDSPFVSYAICCILSSFDKQLHLADLIGDLPWQFDLQSGMLSFGDQYTFETQVLGTESHETNTWLWAWANEASNIPENLLSASLKMKEYFPEPALPLDQIDGRTLALIASDICQAKAYYRGLYDGGAVYLLITDEKLHWKVDDPLLRVLAVLPQAISALDIPDHRAALMAYLDSYGIDPGQVEAEFDEMGRLVSLQATVGK